MSEYGRKPWRYNQVVIERTFWQALWIWMKGNAWSRKMITYEPVSPDEAGFDEAFYEAAIIWGPVTKCQLDKHKH